MPAPHQILDPDHGRLIPLTATSNSPMVSVADVRLFRGRSEGATGTLTADVDLEWSWRTSSDEEYLLHIRVDYTTTAHDMVSTSSGVYLRERSAPTTETVAGNTSGGGSVTAVSISLSLDLID
ncbi:hypothetical protein [Microbacterium thalli]|uniref:Uncharacterized protein n=1 Tax=Microbacterium thalli TaxID=3027921 RepID=A0ABT5SLA8_9MICO|nr:hypothetical protein [Microbacterium thalli]MDD7963574.1 hypothetical protein [Microbacterium thalli]MDN8549554.1 hypothetical protein [Microbacterium thalli]